MSWPGTDFDNELDRYKAALERIVEFGDGLASWDSDFLHVYSIADVALSPKSAEPDDGW